MYTLNITAGSAKRLIDERRHGAMHRDGSSFHHVRISHHVRRIAHPATSAYGMQFLINIWSDLVKSSNGKDFTTSLCVTFVSTTDSPLPGWLIHSKRAVGLPDDEVGLLAPSSASSRQALVFGEAVPSLDGCTIAMTLPCPWHRSLHTVVDVFETSIAGPTIACSVQRSKRDKDVVF